MTVAYAPGKVILFGEHAVVYGHPAVAVPVAQVRARTEITDASDDQGIVIVAKDLCLTCRIDAYDEDHEAHPLIVTVRNTLERLCWEPERGLIVEVSSTIPIASGMGSGAAVATSIVRAMSAHSGATLTPAQVSELVYRTEIIHHGTPSGIDNSVVAFEKPIFFVKGDRLEAFDVGCPFRLLIADTGVRSSTKDAVMDVRVAWENDREHYESLFFEMGEITLDARRAISEGDVESLGPLLQRNQGLLRSIQVSSAEIEALVAAAEMAGAQGAKLSGAGRGGNVIALVTEEVREKVAFALEEAGAVRVIATEVA